MINFMKEGEFVRANDIYLLTAIGNAPWPIGLTMVGIHERSGAYIVGSSWVVFSLDDSASVALYEATRERESGRPTCRQIGEEMLLTTIERTSCDAALVAQRARRFVSRKRVAYRAAVRDGIESTPRA